MKTKFLITAIICITLASCTSNSNKTISTTIDDVVSWGADLSRIEKGAAHSGIYYTKVDSLIEYSLTFYKPLSEITKDKISKIKFQAWCKAKSLPKKATLVCSAEIENSFKVAYIGVEVAKQLQNVNEWTLIKGELQLPKEVPANTIIKVYLYSPIHELIYADDFEIQFIKY